LLRFPSGPRTARRADRMPGWHSIGISLDTMLDPIMLWLSPFRKFHSGCGRILKMLGLMGFAVEIAVPFR
ncbi:hypothetical protein, partial [Imhoffiella purpurea]|uniref:hypothetical protein n=1 Tax=Imhoffiella purpurea TaxID=1249627 RepID=UPI001E52668D